MLKTVSFDKNFRKPGKYAYEHNMLHEFMSSERENMCFEYDNVISASRAVNAMYNHVSENRMPLRIARRKNLVFIWRKDSENVCIRE